MIKYADDGNKHNYKFLNLKRRKPGVGGGAWQTFSIFVEKYIL